MFDDVEVRSDPSSRTPSPPVRTSPRDKARRPSGEGRSPERALASASELMRQRLGAGLGGPKGRISIGPSASESAKALQARKELERMLEDQRALDEERERVEEMLFSESFSSALRAALVRWATHADTLRTLAAALAAFQGHAVLRALNTWHWWHSERLAAFRMLRRGATGMLHARTRAALNAWAYFVQCQCAQLALVRSAANSMRDMGRRKALNSWRDTTRAAAEALRLMRGAATSIRQSGLRKAWLSWAVLASEKAEAERKLRGAAASLRHVSTRRALNTWGEQAASVGAALSQLRAAGTALRQTGLMRAMQTWLEIATGARDARDSMRRAIGRMRSAALCAALTSWSEVAQAAAAAMRKLRAAATSMRSAGLRKALNSWRDATRAAAEALRLMRGAATSIRQSGLRKAWLSWAVLASEKAEAERKLRGAATSLANLPLRRGLNTWREVSMRLAHRRNLGRRVAVALLSQSLHRALNSWRDTACSRKGLSVRCLFGRRLSFGRHFMRWRERVARHSSSKIECLVTLAHLSGLFARSKMRARLMKWSRIAYRLKVKRRLSSDLAGARKQIQGLRDENAALRQAMEVLASGEAWKDARDAELIKLRRELERSEAAVMDLRTRNADLREKYDRLRHATCDPNYILVGGAQQAPAKHAVVQVGPAGKETRETGTPPQALAHPFSPRTPLTPPQPVFSSMIAGALGVDAHVRSYHPQQQQQQQQQLRLSSAGGEGSGGDGGAGYGGGNGLGESSPAGSIGYSPGCVPSPGPHHASGARGGAAASAGWRPPGELRGSDLLSTFAALPHAMQQRIDDSLRRARRLESRTTPERERPTAHRPRTPTLATARITPAPSLSTSSSISDLNFNSTTAPTIMSRLRQIQALEKVAGVISGINASREAWK